MMYHKLKEDTISKSDYILGYYRNKNDQIVVCTANQKKAIRDDITEQYLDRVMNYQASRILEEKEYNELSKDYMLMKQLFKGVIPLWLFHQGFTMYAGYVGAYESKEKLMIVSSTSCLSMLLLYASCFNYFSRHKDLKKIKYYASICNILKENPNINTMDFSEGCSKKSINIINTDGEIKINRLEKYSLKDIKSINNNLCCNSMVLIK